MTTCSNKVLTTAFTSFHHVCRRLRSSYMNLMSQERWFYCIGYRNALFNEVFDAVIKSATRHLLNSRLPCAAKIRNAYYGQQRTTSRLACPNTNFRISCTCKNAEGGRDIRSHSKHRASLTMVWQHAFASEEPRRARVRWWSGICVRIVASKHRACRIIWWG